MGKTLTKFLLLWALLLTRPESLLATSVTATLDRENIIVGETTGLHVSVQDGTPQSMEPFPAITGLNIQQQAPAQSTTIINGQRNSAIILNFAVTGTQHGEYTIPAITL